MTPSALAPNTYDVTLVGPGYNYSGISILSSQKRISFSLGQIPPSPAAPILQVRAVTGPFNINKRNGTTAGWDQPAGPLENRVQFKVQAFP